jgi:hypothetical protein
MSFKKLTSQVKPDDQCQNEKISQQLIMRLYEISAQTGRALIGKGLVGASKDVRYWRLSLTVNRGEVKQHSPRYTLK